MMKAMVQQQEIENVSIAVSLDTKRRTAESLSGGRRSEVRGRSEDQRRENATVANEKGIFRRNVRVGLEMAWPAPVDQGHIPEPVRW